MLRLVPTYAAQLAPEQNRTRLQLVGLGVPNAPASLRGSVVIHVDANGTPGRRLCASTLIDYVVRLDPLVGELIVDADGADELIGDLPDRFPLAVSTCTDAPSADVAVSIGAPRRGCDLIVDAAGWLASVDELVESRDDGNPIGPLAAAALGAGEVFKLLFRRRLSDLPFTRRLVPHHGVFSLYSYHFDRLSPALPPVPIDAILVGAGGVGAGILAAFAHMRHLISGRLAVIDADRLDWTNLNRVTYATVAGARTHALKVDVATAYMAGRVPALTIEPVPSEYKQFARRVPARRDRHYPLVLTALDDDDVRWQVQRDLPRTLIDAATGVAANCRVERVLFGRNGCLGCSRPPGQTGARARPDGNCDAPPDPHAPSISFLSGFAGTLAAAEAIKVMIAPDDALDGYFEHLFPYGVNPEQRGAPALHPCCPVDCRNPTVLQAFADKWPT